jgi:uncharacterized membrane protein YqiK
MSKFSRRSALNAVIPSALLGLALKGDAQAAQQPQMRAALDSLHAAERHLEKAASDKGGHRVKALKLVRQAINEVEKGIEFDRRR